MRVLFFSAPARWPDREVQANASRHRHRIRHRAGRPRRSAVSTAEHVLAALRGMGVDNATIEVDGPEVPIMDGSAAAFVAAIEQAGIVTQSAPRRFIQVLKPVQVAIGDCLANCGPTRRLPRRSRNRFHQSRDRPPEHIARSQPRILPPRDLPRPHFRLHERCREAVERRLRARRLVREFGGVRRGRLLNTEGLRYADECVRHKALDVIGDLALAGVPLLGAYRSVRGGHKLNHAVLSALMADRTAWRVVGRTRARRRVTPRPERHGGRHDRPGLRPRRVLTSALAPPTACPSPGFRGWSEFRARRVPATPSSCSRRFV